MKTINVKKAFTTLKEQVSAKAGAVKVAVAQKVVAHNVLRNTEVSDFTEVTDAQVISKLQEAAAQQEATVQETPAQEEPQVTTAAPLAKPTKLKEELKSMKPTTDGINRTATTAWNKTTAFFNDVFSYDYKAFFTNLWNKTKAFFTTAKTWLNETKGGRFTKYAVTSTLTLTAAGFVTPNAVCAVGTAVIARTLFDIGYKKFRKKESFSIKATLKSLTVHTLSMTGMAVAAFFATPFVSPIMSTLGSTATTVAVTPAALVFG